MVDDTDAGWPLEKMAGFERTIGSLYAAFADMLPGHREFWEAISAEEEQHADWIEGFSDLDEAGAASISAFKFSMREIDEPAAGKSLAMTVPLPHAMRVRGSRRWRMAHDSDSGTACPVPPATVRGPFGTAAWMGKGGRSR